MSRGEPPKTGLSGRLVGIHPVLEALRAGSRSFERVYVVRGRGGKEFDEILDRCRKGGIPFSVEPREVLDRLGGERHQGVVGIVSAKAYVPVEDLLRAAERRGEDPFLLILSGVEDPRNLGAILRTAEGAGVHGVILPERRAAGLTETAAKTSAGALEHLPVARVGNIRQTVASLKQRGVWVMALDSRGETRYDRMDYKRPLAILIGGEDQGLGPTILSEVDARLSIPLAGHVTSLNVSVAAGVMIFEVLRSRDFRKTEDNKKS